MSTLQAFVTITCCLLPYLSLSSQNYSCCSLISLSLWHLRTNPAAALSLSVISELILLQPSLSLSSQNYSCSRKSLGLLIIIIVAVFHATFEYACAYIRMNKNEYEYSLAKSIRTMLCGLASQWHSHGWFCIDFFFFFFLATRRINVVKAKLSSRHPLTDRLA